MLWKNQSIFDINPFHVAASPVFRLATGYWLNQDGATGKKMVDAAVALVGLFTSFSPVVFINIDSNRKERRVHQDA